MLNAFLVLLGLASMAAPCASAMTLNLPADVQISDIEAPAEEDLFIVSAGDLLVSGNLQTVAADSAGASGPSIIIKVAGTLFLSPGATVKAADGRDAAPVAEGGLAVAGSGGRGGSVKLQAQRIVTNGALIQPGNGGDGGAAFAWGVPHASAWGGDGGDAGSLDIEGRLEGQLRFSVVHAGIGGLAEAQGAKGADCPGTSGAGATSRGRDAIGLGNGENASATATGGACGPVDGTGGTGGDASAYGGNGGTNPNGDGGHGGNATAIGGRGGDGLEACFETTEEARASGIRHSGHGGKGGNATAIGGNGGNGLFMGGEGGGAYAREQGGNAGNATPPIEYGTGGANSGGGGRIKGGDGGIGENGGGGGDAIGEGQSGNGGSLCGPLIYHGLDVPMPGVAPIVVLLCLLAVSVRRPGSRLD